MEVAAAAGTSTRSPYGSVFIGLPKGHTEASKADYASEKYEGAVVCGGEHRGSLGDSTSILRVVDGSLLCVSIADGAGIMTLASGVANGNAALQAAADGLMARADDDDVHPSGGGLFTIPDGSVVSHHVISHGHGTSDMSADGTELTSLLAAQSPASLQSSAANDSADCGGVADGSTGTKQKRKGGWPKGKRRKPVPQEGVLLKGPVSGYVLFAKERRKCLRQTHPYLSFSDATRMLGKEWSDMDADLKQKYLNQADTDRERYKEQLRAYQESEIYQNFAKRKSVKRFGPGGHAGEDYPVDELIALDDSSVIYGVDDEDPNELHCRVCNKFFSNLHNKKEHMVGKVHLQNLSTELEKEVKLLDAAPAAAAAEQRAPDESCCGGSEAASAGGVGATAAAMAAASLSVDGGGAGDAAQGSCAAADARAIVAISVRQPVTAATATPAGGAAGSPPVDLEAFVNGFVRQNYERELEIEELHANVARLQAEQLLLQTDQAKLQALQAKLHDDVEKLKVHGAQITACINSLRILPTLFGTIDF